MGEDRPWRSLGPIGGFQAAANGIGISGSAAATGQPIEISGSHPSLPRYNPEAARDTDLACASIDEVDSLRAAEYGLLATLLREAPDRDTLKRLTSLQGDAAPLGRAHTALAEVAATTDPQEVEREFFNLFVGLARGELLPYASYYLTGSLNDRPLVRVRQDLAAIGLEAVESLREPEDHIAILCEVMARFAGRHFDGEAGAERRFFERHLQPWAGHFFADLERSEEARFYRPVGTLGRLFMAIESEALAIAAAPGEDPR
ncbi:MAG: TorD/DmsD family molecular chaperone [Acetobacteraceae bacterium]